MNSFRIKTIWTGTYYSAMIIDRETDSAIAERRLTNGKETAETQAMRRAINSHLNSGGTLGNYQW